MLADPAIDFLADAVLVVHVGIAAFVVGGLALVLLGRAMRWRWVDQVGFRAAHVVAIGIVVAESLFGVVCPLTTLEMWLRSRAGASTYGGGFIEHWIGQVLFYNAPPWVFTACYSAFGLAVLATWWFFPPRRQRRSDRRIARRSR